MSEDKNSIRTDSNIPVKRYYAPSDIRKENESDPGTYPYLRGIYPTMYRERHWTMRQYSGFGSAEETNNRFKFLLGHGQTGLSLAFEFNTCKDFSLSSSNTINLSSVFKSSLSFFFFFEIQSSVLIKSLNFFDNSSSPSPE